MLPAPPDPDELARHFPALAPVLSYRSGRRADLEALLGSLSLLFELSVVPC